ncbi:hypothetical protein K1X76_00985 [bacterium]|nr:hypothetical protein [bacterium]
MKNVNLFFLFLFLLSCESQLPPLPPRVGSMSYQSGSLQVWQQETLVTLQKALGISDDEKNKALNADARIKFLLKDDNVQSWSISYNGFDGKELQAYLLAPLKPVSQKMPTLIVLHGHDADNEDAAFNNKSYMHGMGYRLAKRGFMVMVPQLRGFYNFSFQHNRYVKKLKRNFVGIQVLDMMKAQSVLEGLDSSKVGGIKVNPSLNGIVGVNFGALVSLVAGAMDARFEVVSNHGLFVGFEELFSSRHHFCEFINPLGGVLNMDDVALLVYPRKMHLAMGANDSFYDDSSRQLVERLKIHLEPLAPLCENAPSVKNCRTVVEIAPDKGHEFIDSGVLESLF